MSTSTIVWIAVAVAAAILLIVVAIVAIGARNRRRQRQAEEIREQARVETARVEQREALAQETAAKARAAQAEAEVKAAEAARLQDHAAKHQSEAATSREQVQERLDRAETIAPKQPKETSEARDPDAAWGEESHEPATNAEAFRPNARLCGSATIALPGRVRCNRAAWPSRAPVHIGQRRADPGG